ncbi:TRAP transporter substrate-binding protein [Clostridium sp. AM58-1XD]|uniref:TRAP transporter substrate-binding protein n=1 Tax=Clostridium sp. AM58-1XD TaxID=2292307 RepID=UPI000E466EEF|nr:TRAP transporter substrate-binding protein [Clostridium sp. AM58-1XD]RGZ00646.1 hypothetical protein DXA13_04240 [Clostridium sp. AM58-1XD]
MKKVLATLLAVGLAASCVGCGGSPKTETTAAPAATEAAKETEAAEEKGTDTTEAAASGDVITLSICDSQPASSLLGQAIGTSFADALADLSGGTMQVQYYPAAQLGNGTTCMQMVQLGTLDMYRCDASALYDYGIASMAVPSLPYIFRDRQHAIEVAHSEIGDKLLQDITDSGTGFVGVGWLVDTPRAFFTAKKEIKTLADLKGLKMRSVEANLYLDYKAALGMNPTPLAFSEVYTSLSTGVIDAAANTLDSFVSNKLYEVCKYFVMNNGMIPAYPVVISEKTWAKLNDEQKGWVLEAWQTAGDYFAKEGDALMEDQIAFCEEHGVTFCYPEDEDAWKEACKNVTAEYGEGFEDMIAEIEKVGQ